MKARGLAGLQSLIFIVADCKLLRHENLSLIVESLVCISIWVPLLGFGLHSARLAMCRFTQTNVEFMSVAFACGILNLHLFEMSLEGDERETTMFLFLMEGCVV